MAQQSVPPPGVGVPPEMPQHQESFFRRHQVILIFVPFVVISLVVIGAGFQSYRIGRGNQLYMEAMYEGKPENSIEPLRELIELSSPNNAYWRQKLGESYIALKQYKEAASEFESLQKDQPGTDLDESLMTCYYELGDREKGRLHLDNIMKKNGNSPSANYYLAGDLILEKRYTDAGIALKLAGGDEKWNERAADRRKELAAFVFGEGRETGRIDVPPATASAESQPATTATQVELTTGTVINVDPSGTSVTTR